LTETSSIRAGKLAPFSWSGERHELLAGMASRGFADYFAGYRVECSNRAELAIGLVFKAVTAGTSW
jgi:hypothetical protein